MLWIKNHTPHTQHCGVMVPQRKGKYYVSFLGRQPNEPCTPCMHLWMPMCEQYFWEKLDGCVAHLHEASKFQIATLHVRGSFKKNIRNGVGLSENKMSVVDPVVYGLYILYATPSTIPMNAAQAKPFMRTSTTSTIRYCMSWGSYNFWNGSCVAHM